MGAEFSTDDKGIVHVDRDPVSHIARITFDNPSKKNAMNLDMVNTLGRALDELAVDDDIKVVVLRGTGGVFTTGADLSQAYNWYAKEGDTRRPSQRRRLAVDRAGQRIFHEFIGYPKVTITQVEAYAFGAGLELALASDLAVVGRNAKLGMPATRFLGPVLGNLHLFFHRLGPNITRDLLLTGRQAIASEYEHAHIFARVLPDEDVAATTEELAAQVARMPADGIAIAKEAYRLVEGQTALAAEETCAYLFHSYGTNLRFEDDEFNFVKERSRAGSTGAAFKKRDEFYDGGSGGRGE
ncbi:enoyl-CoA hydratase/isomerase family protein [Sporichthya polymorpha]|uniref:enoyl-CoA hydratase/isomerase family protein n=1 Tax=Sporichthya polymorpha TaxID=35751 RepID=UPI00035F87AF|nr:enoyl-CoA hydratase/isomerase family protein [Sporichthya polymorpha]